MDLSGIAVKVLLGISTALGVASLPSQFSDTWEWKESWTDKGGIQVFHAESKKIILECAKNPTGTVQFPPVVHGAHEIFLDGKRVAQFGDSSFERVQSFYGAPVLLCADIKDANELIWTVYSYSKYFARFGYFPYVHSGKSVVNVFAETANLMAAGSLLVLALFSFLIFWKRMPNQLTFSIVFACLALSVYFMGAVAGYLNLSGKMLLVHKVADLGVWIGLACFFNALRVTGIIGRSLYFVYAFHIFAALVCIIIGADGDSVQFGTTLPFGMTIVASISGVLTLGRMIIRSGFNKREVFAFFSLSLFLGAACNEIFVVTGLANSFTIFNIGCLGGVLFFTLSVNERISETYNQRDYLQANLEKEIQSKTLALRAKTEDLESALDKLKTTQAELIQSARLASLGTLSAGIAHEINNSLNYVYGSLRPLERLIEVSNDENLKKKATNLTGLMSEGLKLTFQIIKSLKSSAGLNQAQLNHLDLSEIVASVTIILKNKSGQKNVEVVNEVSEGTVVFGSIVGLNQVLLNIIGNSIDAVDPERGRVVISAVEGEDNLRLIVSDNGSGIEDHIRDRIFEPFFTTKEVGSGTGLGLHIVKQEIGRHGGTIHVESNPGVETRVIIDLPREQKIVSEEMVA